jgi:hypothetical protein
MAPPLHYPGSKPTGTAKESVMNLKAIIASLVLGSSSIAMASPSVTLSATQPVNYQPGWRGAPKPPVYRPVTLASAMRFISGRAAIAVGAQAGRFDTLQITAASGRTVIQQVLIQFDNGQTQLVRNLGRTLDGNDRLTIDLDGNHRAIRRIVVTGSELAYGRRRPNSAFTITAA